MQSRRRGAGPQRARTVLGETEQDNNRKQLHQQTALARFGELALRSDNLDEILTEACRLVGEALGTDLAKVMALQDDGETLLVRAGVGWKPGVVGEAASKASDNTSEGHALKSGRPMISPDIATETRFTIRRSWSRMASRRWPTWSSVAAEASRLSA